MVGTWRSREGTVSAQRGLYIHISIASGIKEETHRQKLRRTGGVIEIQTRRTLGRYQQQAHRAAGNQLGPISLINSLILLEPPKEQIPNEANRYLPETGRCGGWFKK